MEPTKSLMLTYPGHKLVVHLMGNVEFGKWGSTGSILSVKDLLAAQAVVQPLFSWGSGVNERERLLALQIWAGTALESLEMYTGDGRRWALDALNSRIVRVHEAPFFVGQFRGPIKPNTIIP